MLIGNRSVLVSGRSVTIDGVTYYFEQPLQNGKPIKYPANLPPELREVVGDAVMQMGPRNLTEER